MRRLFERLAQAASIVGFIAERYIEKHLADDGYPPCLSDTIANSRRTEFWVKNEVAIDTYGAASGLIDLALNFTRDHGLAVRGDLIKPREQIVAPLQLKAKRNECFDIVDLENLGREL